MFLEVLEASVFNVFAAVQLQNMILWLQGEADLYLQFKTSDCLFLVLHLAAQAGPELPGQT